MAKAKKQERPITRQEVHGVERLTLRVSSMINHPIAQEQRWVTIHRLDTDGEREWDEVIGAIAETDGIDITFNDEDESVTLRWEAQEDTDPVAQDEDDLRVIEQEAPF